MWLIFFGVVIWGWGPSFRRGQEGPRIAHALAREAPAPGLHVAEVGPQLALDALPQLHHAVLAIDCFPLTMGFLLVSRL